MQATVSVETMGEGPDALLLPALSSIATRREMLPLADRLRHRVRCVLADWPGFGALASGPLTPALLDHFLDHLQQAAGLRPPIVGIAAGHGAIYLLRDAVRHPGRYRQLVLVAPTWRGPLPTMTGGRRPDLCRRVRQVLEAPLPGPALFSLNLSRPVVAWMMREHVYADPAAVTPAVLDEKCAVARRPGARQATAAFVSGGLDPAASRAEALSLLDADLPPVLLLRPRGAPRRSAAEMDALTATKRVHTVAVDGALAPHEECPDAVAAAILSALAHQP